MIADRYRWFRVRGYRAQEALHAARALELGRCLGLEVAWSEEEERYVDVFGQLDGDDTQARIDRGELLCLYGLVQSEEGEVLASLGMVTVTGWDDPYLRFEEAELLSEAASIIRQRVRALEEGWSC